MTICLTHIDEADSSSTLSSSSSASHYMHGNDHSSAGITALGDDTNNENYNTGNSSYRVVVGRSVVPRSVVPRSVAGAFFLCV